MNREAPNFYFKDYSWFSHIWV